MSLVNQVLKDLEERRGTLPPTAQATLSGLAADERSLSTKEPPSSRRAGLLLLLLLASMLLVKRETLLERFPIPAPLGRAFTATKIPLPAPHADISSTAAQSAPIHDATEVQQSESPSAASPAAAPSTAVDSVPASTDVAELTQLEARKEGNGVALWLHLTAPVEYTLESDPRGGAMLRLANVRLREGYLQAFDGNGLIHDVEVRHGDGGEVAVRFSLRAGIGTGKVEITAAEGGGYQLVVHCDNEGIAPAVKPDVAGSAPARLASAPTRAEVKVRAQRPRQAPPAPQNKRELQAKKAPPPAARADIANAEHGAVESEQPGDFRMIPRATVPPDRKTELYQSAISALRGGDRARALALGRQAMDADPTAVAPRVLVATMLMEDKHPAEARALLEAGLSQAPGNRDYKLLYARLLSETGEAGKAIGLLTHDAPAPADDPDYHALLAALMQRAGHHDDAIVSYRRLLLVQPQNGLWWMGLGISLSATGQRQQARDAFSRALTDQNLPGRLRQFLNEQLQQLQGANT